MSLWPWISVTIARGRKAATRYEVGNQCLVSIHREKAEMIHIPRYLVTSPSSRGHPVAGQGGLPIRLYGLVGLFFWFNAHISTSIPSRLHGMGWGRRYFGDLYPLLTRLSCKHSRFQAAPVSLGLAPTRSQGQDLFLVPFASRFQGAGKR